MKLLAGSIEVAGDTFLHAGYISAQPRTFHEMGTLKLCREKVKVIDVKKALDLREPGKEAKPAATTVALSPSHPLPPGMVISEGFTLAIVFFFFAWLVSFYYRRVRKIAKPQWWPWVIAGVPLLTFLAVILISHWAVPAARARHLNHLNSVPPPWDGIPVQDYQNPEMATHAILHGLIVNALAGAPTGVTGLPAIQDQVAFPVAVEEYTPGMMYAQKTYGRDGWGREFRFEPLENESYRIASAGADGAFGTNDDIVAVTGSRKGPWELAISGVYFRVVAGKRIFFLHRVEDPKFRTAQEADARKMTNNDLFDMFSFHEWLGYKEPAVMAQLKQQGKQEPEERTAPLLFVQFGSDNE